MVVFSWMNVPGGVLGRNCLAFQWFIASIDLDLLEWASHFLLFVVHILQYLIYTIISTVLRKSTKGGLVGGGKVLEKRA
jgi:hypothetical protein